MIRPLRRRSRIWLGVLALACAACTLALPPALYWRWLRLDRGPFVNAVVGEALLDLKEGATRPVTFGTCGADSRTVLQLMAAYAGMNVRLPRTDLGEWSPSEVQEVPAVLVLDSFALREGYLLRHEGDAFVLEWLPATEDEWKTARSVLRFVFTVRARSLERALARDVPFLRADRDEPPTLGTGYTWPW